MQRKCAACEEEDEIVRRKTIDNANKNKTAQPARKSTSNSNAICGNRSSSPSALSGTQTGGRPLPSGVRSFFEPRFGHDFSQVRIHTGPEASESAASINARAFTYGSHIVFGAGEQQPESTPGRKLLAHELVHVVQQSNAAPGHRLLSESQATQPLGGIPRAPASVPLAAVGQASDPVIQRQVAPSTHTSPVFPNVPSEKWRSDVESAYRRAGNVEAANAVRACRELGECGHILTEREAWNAYRTGRITANLGAPPETGPGGSTAPSLAVAGVAAPAALAPSAVSGAQATAARTALQRAAVRWGTAAVLEGGAAAEAGAGAAAATGTAAGVATVAVPILGAVVITLAVIDLVGYASFQSALHRLGYVILPEPLGVCIGLCHQPSAPTIREPFPFPRPEPLDPRLIEEWLKRETPAPRPTPGPGPVAPPFPFPEPRQRRRRRRKCRPDPCEHPLPISWPAALPWPSVSPRILVRTTAEEREWEGIDRGPEQRRFQAEIRRNRQRLVPPPNPCFQDSAEPNAPYDAHHAHPLYLGGEDANYNLCSLRADMHQLGHPRLDNQTQHLDEYLECGICSGFLSQHPPGQTYEIVGSK
jgi:hypothetical protein